MRRNRRLAAFVARLGAALAAAALLPGCSGGSSSGSSAVEGAPASRFEGAALPGNGIPAPDFTLTDQHGREVSLAAERGEVTLLAFLYPSCGAPCTLIAQQIRGALDDLRRAVPVLIVDAAPRGGHSGAAGARFLARVGLTGRAELLAGTPQRVNAVLRSYRVRPPRRHGAAAFGRATPVVLIDRQGRQRVLFGVEQLTPDALAHDIEALAGEPIRG
jgi:protein SCO1